MCNIKLVKVSLLLFMLFIEFDDINSLPNLFSNESVNVTIPATKDGIAITTKFDKVEVTNAIKLNKEIVDPLTLQQKYVGNCTEGQENNSAAFEKCKELEIKRVSNVSRNASSVTSKLNLYSLAVNKTPTQNISFPEQIPVSKNSTPNAVASPVLSSNVPQFTKTTIISDSLSSVKSTEKGFPPSTPKLPHDDLGQGDNKEYNIDLKESKLNSDKNEPPANLGAYGNGNQPRDDAQQNNDDIDFGEEKNYKDDVDSKVEVPESKDARSNDKEEANTTGLDKVDWMQDRVSEKDKETPLDNVYEGNSIDSLDNKDDKTIDYKISKGRMENDGSSNFFVHFITLIIIAVICYLLFHNKHRIIALILEGKDRRPKNRRDSCKYRKLDSNLEETMASTQGSKGNTMFSA